MPKRVYMGLVPKVVGVTCVCRQAKAMVRVTMLCTWDMHTTTSMNANHIECGDVGWVPMVAHDMCVYVHVVMMV